MKRPYNFSAGPATLPLSVLSQIADQMCKWRDSGISVAEMSHRSSAFESIRVSAEMLLRELLNIPNNFQVLFVTGGATLMNAAIPMNLSRRLGENAIIDVVHSGIWSGKALNEARQYATVHTVASSESSHFLNIPDIKTWRRTSTAAYMHVCTNETINGNQFHFLPDSQGIPLVADMTSEIMSREIDFNCYDVIYAGTQKNLGISGLTIMFVREDLIGYATSSCPSVLNWQNLAESHSVFNTPACFAIYVCELMLQWIKKHGGIKAMREQSIEKSNMLYEFLDHSSLYENNVNHACRSRMNVPFFLKDSSLNELFIEQAKNVGLIQIKGHRSVGGMRASLYNAMTVEGVSTLIEYMKKFEKRHF